MFSKKPIIASVDLDSDSVRVINQANVGCVLELENVKVLTKSMKIASFLEKKELNLKAENGFKYAMNHLSKKITYKS